MVNDSRQELSWLVDKVTMMVGSKRLDFSFGWTRTIGYSCLVKSPPDVLLKIKTLTCGLLASFV